MARKWYALDLLARARAHYDAPDSRLSGEAGRAWRTFFASGAAWMAMALTLLRNQSPPGLDRSFNLLGIIKYGLASVGALLCAAAAWWWASPWLLVLVPLVFYAIEARMVFLFPLALDGSRTPFRDANRLTSRAGGTMAVMAVVMPLAAVMLFGGFLGRGFVRCWCLGCLAVCLWYEDLRQAQPLEAVPAATPVSESLPC